MLQAQRGEAHYSIVDRANEGDVEYFSERKSYCNMTKITVNSHINFVLYEQYQTSPFQRRKVNSLGRWNQIVEIVVNKGQISISEICQLFDVSEMTARRDLNGLDRKGLLRRTHGGAIANLGRSYEPPFLARIDKHQEEKSLIGLRAADLILDGDSIALDVGTTTLEIIKGLKDKRNLTIVTNSLQIANEIVGTLSLETDVRLVLTGGIVRARELSMVGHIPEYVYQDLHVDKAFIGIAGISIEDGLTEFNIEDAQIKRALLKTAREKIVVADSSKFGVTTLASVASLKSIDKIVTDSCAPAGLSERIREIGVDVVLAGSPVLD
jgi:DeoR/GlpR family transcriptional regulator of sugar metabolism